jgi:hypothetical protein
METGTRQVGALTKSMEKARDGKGRRAPRLAVELPGSLMGRRSRAVTIVDLSLTGCLVRGDAAELDSAPFTAKVRVTESYLDGSVGSPASPRYLAGLAFLGLQAQEEARLRRFLDEERRRRRGADTPSR